MTLYLLMYFEYTNPSRQVVKVHTTCMNDRVISTPSIYQYLDYQSFLRDFYAHGSSTTGLSYRGFSRRAGFRSPNFLKLVIDGDRRLGLESVCKVANACDLDSTGRDYLRELVLLKRSRSAEAKARTLFRVMAFEERIALFPLEQHASEYFDRWWVPVVRELSAAEGFRPDPQWVASSFGGRITEAQATRALMILQKLGLLHGGSSDVFLTTGDELRTPVMRHYHQQLLEIARGAIDEAPPDERDISAITIAGDESTFAEAKRMVQRFRKELLKLERRSRGRSHIYQFCLQLFPVAKVPAVESQEMEKVT